MGKIDLFNLVVENTLKVIPGIDPSRISIEQELADLGANSMDRMEISALCMEDLGIVVPATEFISVSNIESLVDLFLGKIA